MSEVYVLILRGLAYWLAAVPTVIYLLLCSCSEYSCFLLHFLFFQSNGEHNNDNNWKKNPKFLTKNRGSRG